MPYDALSDETLAQRIDSRDADALSTLYDRYACQAHAVALLVTHEPNAAAAVVEELFWQFWQRGAPPFPGIPFRNALMLRARRLAERMAQPQPAGPDSFAERIPIRRPVRS